MCLGCQGKFPKANLSITDEYIGKDKGKAYVDQGEGIEVRNLSCIICCFLDVLLPKVGDFRQKKTGSSAFADFQFQDTPQPVKITYPI